MTETFTIKPYVDHGTETVEVLQRVLLSGATYPPSEAGTTTAQLQEWLLSEQGLGRWVAVGREESTVIGHVQLTLPHSYLTNHLTQFGYESLAPNGFAEVSKLFADPLAAHRGVGTQLLSAVRDFSWSVGRQPALAVVSTSLIARRMYAREGLIEIGTFEGVHGVNHVLVDPLVTEHALRGA